MTIETQVSKVSYVGDGAARIFPVPFPVRQAEHVRLYLASALGRDIEYEAEYSVGGIGSEEASVTLSAPLASGENLAIVRLVPLTQQMDLENGGSFDAETIERQFDITEMQIQQLQEQIDRAVKVPVTGSVQPDDFWQELLDASRAAVEAYNGVVKLADPESLDSYVANVRRSATVVETVPAGGILTLPAWYYPKRNILYLAVDGMVCTPRLPDCADQSERQYEEIGDDPNILSDRVRVHFPVEAGMVVDAWVVASNLVKEMTGLADAAEAAARSAEEAGGAADRAAEEARTAGEKALEAAGSAAEAARAASEVGTGTGATPDASPDQRGLAPAGGLANQIYRANADGDAYGWETGLATPARAGFVSAGGVAGQVYQVSPDGADYGWADPPSSGGGGNAIMGEIRLLPFRTSDLAEHCPGWHFCNGDLYPIGDMTTVGGVLASLPDNFKTDWDIAEDGDGNISIPNLFYSDGRGKFIRPGTEPGTVTGDAIRNITGYPGYSPYANLVTPSGAFYSTSTGKGGCDSSQTGHIVYMNISRVVPTADENRPLHTTMTPAIFLGV